LGWAQGFDTSEAAKAIYGPGLFLKVFQIIFVIICIIHHWDCLFEEITDMMIELLNSGCSIVYIQNNLKGNSCWDSECYERVP
jgi:hypothetical protein